MEQQPRTYWQVLWSPTRHRGVDWFWRIVCLTMPLVNVIVQVYILLAR